MSQLGLFWATVDTCESHISAPTEAHISALTYKNTLINTGMGEAQPPV